MPRFKISPAFARFLRRETSGASAVEFALISPVLILILAGLVDIGASLKAKFDLSSAISAGSNYALLGADKVNSAGGGTLAGNILAVVANGLGNAGGSVQVVVNNGATVNYNTSNGTATQTGTVSNADLCYCPTGSAASVTWGSAVTCGSTCPAGGIGGKFVTISASRFFSPLFGGFDVVNSGNITVRAMVQPQ
ncbi:TadE/TadG family type IV pilus assembly protein [Mesorhizobium sp. B2-7-2]|uniref:TadE/TadG family type IV pilus assembly protein n=1 Tax=Mesorhizobium sp. B2-7-2 TaxID=2589908 RepID=UPI001127EDA6|nr:TadE/TadG family type IV pilus assembly protein [Mesorhizobium sp. B2-7-2]TPJ17221.1 pilus assembly protein [Mesorhizobium sp. B2-7-2]